MMTEPKAGKSKFEKAEEVLDTFEEGLGLKSHALSTSLLDEALRYLNLDSEGRERLTPEECAEASLVISQYAAYIGRACQKEESRMMWAEEEADRIIAPFLSHVNMYGKWEKRLALINQNKESQTYESIRKESQAKFKRLLYLTQRLDKVADAYRNMSIIKKREVR